MRLGLIGTGYWAAAVHAPSIAEHTAVELAGVWGRDAARTGELAQRYGARAYPSFNALLDDVEAVDFAIAPDAQAELAIQAAQQGKHVLLEKPIASTAESAQPLERAVEEAGVGSIVFFTRRFTPETANWLDRAAQKGGWECGRAEFAASIFVPEGPYSNSQWRRDKGALWDIGPHALSLLWPVLGEVTSVLAGAGRGDQVHLVLRHAEGQSSTVSLSLTVPRTATGSQMYVYGEGGRDSAPLGPMEQTDIVAAHRRALDALIEQARQAGSGHPCDVHFGARVVEVLDAAEQSLRTGCLVQIAPRVGRTGPN
jgi:predicted dehydrogenase